ncbi:MAG: hypothetical protein Q8M26_14635 [Pseudolabrys sp.]|nr:hypothetical protein [Pseudolabrys sp.]
MNYTSQNRKSGAHDAANDHSGDNDLPPDEDLVAVLASRESVLAAATAMGHKPAGNENGENSNASQGAAEQPGAADKKKGRDRKYRNAERHADAKAGITPCPLKFPTDLHRSLRERANDAMAPEGSRALLAFTSFAMRRELTDILAAIELRDDREELLHALQSIVQLDWLAKTAIRLAAVGPKPPTPLHAHIPRLVDAMARSSDTIRAIMAVEASPALQRLCIELADKVSRQEQLLDLAKDSVEAEFAWRMVQLSSNDRDFLLSLLDLDPESKRALAAAARYPEVSRLIVNAARNSGAHAAILAVVRNSAVANTGLAVIEGKGLVGWIARMAVSVLIRRAHIVSSSTP